MQPRTVSHLFMFCKYADLSEGQIVLRVFRSGEGTGLGRRRTEGVGRVHGRCGRALVSGGDTLVGLPCAHIGVPATVELPAFKIVRHCNFLAYFQRILVDALAEEIKFDFAWERVVRLEHVFLFLPIAAGCLGHALLQREFSYDFS